LKYWFALVLFVVSSQTVLANDTVRIGVFWLYDIRVIQAASIDSPVIISGNEKRPDIVLTAGRKLTVQRDGKSLFCSVTDRSGRTIQQWHDATVVLNANNVNGESSLSIPGKIVRTFRGTVTITPASPAPSAPKTEIRVILETDRESTISAVAASEMPIAEGKADLQALKSFAVVIRTFMTSHPHRHSEEGFDYCDSTHCQHYQGEEFTSP
jgi:stage II sporulation protein D